MRARLARRADGAGTRHVPAPWLARCQSPESALRLFRSPKYEPGKHRPGAPPRLLPSPPGRAPRRLLRGSEPWPNKTPKAGDFVRRTGTGRASIRFDPLGIDANRGLRYESPG